MRKLLLSMCMLLILTAGADLFSQNTPNNYQKGIIAGTKQWFIISFTDRTSSKAKILSVKGDDVIIQERSRDSRMINRNSIARIDAIPYGKIGGIGLGLGVPYGGGYGINGEFNILPYLSLNGGLATTILAGPGYSFGVKGYFRKPGPTWRPRVLLFYGTNGIYANDYYNDTYAGFTGGIGQICLWGRHGFDFDLMYILSSELFDAHPDDWVRIKISFGYRFAF